MEPDVTTHDRDPDEVLANYKFTHLQCRVDRHPWSRKAWYRTDYKDWAPGLSRRYVTCPACGMQRWQEIHVPTSRRTGKYGYVPPQGYYTPGTGLRLIDFQDRFYGEDFARAAEAGRVDENYEDEPEPAPVTKLKPKKAS